MAMYRLSTLFRASKLKYENISSAKKMFFQLFKFNTDPLIFNQGRQPEKIPAD